jgi:hypothetical protein
VAVEKASLASFSLSCASAKLLILRWSVAISRSKKEFFNSHRRYHQLSGKCLINAVTGKVGSGTQLTGNPTNQELAAFPTYR